MNLVFTDLSFRNKTGQGITTEVVIGGRGKPTRLFFRGKAANVQRKKFKSLLPGKLLLKTGLKKINKVWFLEDEV